VQVQSATWPTAKNQFRRVIVGGDSRRRKTCQVVKPLALHSATGVASYKTVVAGFPAATEQSAVL
jgi:hypothetical protein